VIRLPVLFATMYTKKQQLQNNLEIVVLVIWSTLQM